MKFAGRGYLWDAEKQKFAAEFKDGFFETDDEVLIAKLKDAGYKEFTGSIVVEQSKPEGELTEDDLSNSKTPNKWQEILKQAKSLNISTRGKKMAELLELINQKIS